MANLIEALLEEMNRVREIIKVYEDVLGGEYAAMTMRESIKRAEKAIASGDIIAELRAYNDLKDYEQ